MNRKETYMNEHDNKRIDGLTEENLLTGYIEHGLHPVDLYKESDYLSEKCHVTGTDAFEFLCSRDSIYTDCDSDAEFILCNSRKEVEKGLYLTYGVEEDHDRSLSLLYHSNLYRLDSRPEREEFRRYFPTVTSLEEIYTVEMGCTLDD